MSKWSKYLNFNTVLLSFVGLFLIAKGAWNLFRFRDYIFGSGFISMGIGFILFGITNGFADPTPRGRLLFKVAVPCFLLGVILTAYSMRYFLRF